MSWWRKVGKALNSDTGQSFANGLLQGFAPMFTAGMQQRYQVDQEQRGVQRQIDAETRATQRAAAERQRQELVDSIRRQAAADPQGAIARAQADPELAFLVPEIQGIQQGAINTRVTAGLGAGALALGNAQTAGQVAAAQPNPADAIQTLQPALQDVGQARAAMEQIRTTVPAGTQMPPTGAQALFAEGDLAATQQDMGQQVQALGQQAQTQYAEDQSLDRLRTVASITNDPQATLAFLEQDPALSKRLWWAKAPLRTAVGLQNKEDQRQLMLGLVQMDVPVLQALQAQYAQANPDMARVIGDMILPIQQAAEDKRLRSQVDGLLGHALLNVVDEYQKFVASPPDMQKLLAAQRNLTPEQMTLEAMAAPIISDLRRIAGQAMRPVMDSDATDPQTRSVTQDRLAGIVARKQTVEEMRAIYEEGMGLSPERFGADWQAVMSAADSTQRTLMEQAMQATPPEAPSIFQGGAPSAAPGAMGLVPSVGADSLLTRPGRPVTAGARQAMGLR